ncbi:hypothetical protein CL1_0645 [Thermococcus cleftensis]|uniref:Elongation factor Tu-type domain-containing protein n=1 Tax=Thermococcus cleftensis (strain DSM 27260 / KACC 17922 / CL1) TaxID=163003 RepID=I3ZT17_THECF|nr:MULTISPECIES: tRNA-binding protein Pbp11 [Thermococcus]AFL94851.1 hypothetical protein CL1_0645 [Thermococcus cleftensis]NJE03653.1 translation factor [Thermococcus sp. MV11]
MGILDRFRKKGEVEVVSREPVGKFIVAGVTYVLGKQVLAGIVKEGLIYPGYKLKGKNVALIREIYIQNRKIDFAVGGDEVALLLEGHMEVKTGEVLNVYRS